MTPATPSAGVMVGCIGRVSSSFESCGDVIFRGAAILDEGLMDVVNDDCESDEVALAIEVVSLAGGPADDRPDELKLNVVGADVSMEVKEGEALSVVEGLLP